MNKLYSGEANKLTLLPQKKGNNVQPSKTCLFNNKKSRLSLPAHVMLIKADSSQLLIHSRANAILMIQY